MKRVIFDIILFVSVFIFPWWINVLLLFVGLFLFKNFYEFIVANVIVYSLYAIPGDRMISSPVIFSLIVIVVYIVMQYVRDNIILYKK